MKDSKGLGSDSVKYEAFYIAKGVLPQGRYFLALLICILHV